MSKVSKILTYLCLLIILSTGIILINTTIQTISKVLTNDLSQVYVSETLDAYQIALDQHLAERDNFISKYTSRGLSAQYAEEQFTSYSLMLERQIEYIKLNS